jgi:hypothetical protein
MQFGGVQPSEFSYFPGGEDPPQMDRFPQQNGGLPILSSPFGKALTAVEKARLRGDENVHM